MALCQKNVKYLPDLIRDALDRGLSIQPESLTSFIRKIPEKVQVQLTGPLGLFNTIEGLSPFLGDNSLTQSELNVIIDSINSVVNRRLISLFYKQQEESQYVIERIGSLVWDAPRRIPGVYSRNEDYSMNTPAFHALMDYLINKTIEMNTSEPEQLTYEGPTDLNVLLVKEHLRKGIELLENFSPLVPDLLADARKSFSSSLKLSYLKDLDAELCKTGINFHYLTGLQQPRKPSR